MSMPTGYEVQMYNDIKQIAMALNRIANVMEATEKRARENEGFYRPTTPEDIVRAGEAVQAVKRGFADLEAQVKEGADDQST